MPRILVSDPIADAGVALLRNVEGFEVDVKLGLKPDELKAIAMMRGVAGALEKHHRVMLLDSAIEASVRLSHRYIPGRQLPDKSVSLLDTACARVAVSQHATAPVGGSADAREATAEPLSVALPALATLHR